MGDFCGYWLSMAAFNLASKMAAKLSLFQVLLYKFTGYHQVGTHVEDFEIYYMSLSTET